MVYCVDTLAIVGLSQLQFAGIQMLLDLWIRILGPMSTLSSDQDGGLMSNLGSRLLDSLNIKRSVIGQGGSTTKGLVERHIAVMHHIAVRKVQVAGRIS